MTGPADDPDDGTAAIPTVLWLLHSEGMRWTDLDALVGVEAGRVEWVDRGTGGVSWCRWWDDRAAAAVATAQLRRLVQIGLVQPAAGRRGRGELTDVGQEAVQAWREWRLARARAAA